jgi:hypothetical protein
VRVCIEYDVFVGLYLQWLELLLTDVFIYFVFYFNSALSGKKGQCPNGHMLTVECDTAAIEGSL